MKKIKGIFIFLFIIGLLTISNNFSFGNTNDFNVSKSDLTIDQKIGMNGHIDVPRDILYAGGVVREYHNFGWSITPNKQMYFERFSWWDFDGYYEDLHKHGITILPCIQMGEQAVFNRNRNEKPVMKGDSTTDPMSYKIHANYLYNYAARYGHTVVPIEKLNLDPNDSYKSGLGYITYYEDWNEPDKTWQGPDAQFNSTELAAMLSADYDGHEGKLGDVYGVKQADKNAKLVMGGMAGGSTMVNWLTEMQEWANINRTDKKLPLDVINYHQYAGVHSPENSTFVEDAKKIIDWRNTNASDKEIWITEFGWDTNLGSTKHAAPSEDAQRDWIIREYLIGDRIGLDRMTVYDALNDGPSSDTTQYSTSGLATKVSEGTVKKSSWYGVNTLKNTLKGYKLSEVIKEDNEMYIYKYVKGNDICYVLWSPTESNKVINNYSLNIGNFKNASLTELKNKEDLGITSNLTINNNAVSVNVSESPIFVKVSGIIEDIKNEENTDDEKDNQEEIIDNNDKEENDNKEEIINKNEEENKNITIDNKKNDEINNKENIIINNEAKTNNKVIIINNILDDNNNNNIVINSTEDNIKLSRENSKSTKVTTSYDDNDYDVDDEDEDKEVTNSKTNKNSNNNTDKVKERIIEESKKDIKEESNSKHYGFEGYLLLLIVLVLAIIFSKSVLSNR